MTFDTFKQEALDAGFDEVVERQWDADVFLDTHTHPVSSRMHARRCNRADSSNYKEGEQKIMEHSLFTIVPLPCAWKRDRYLHVITIFSCAARRPEKVQVSLFMVHPPAGDWMTHPNTNQPELLSQQQPLAQWIQQRQRAFADFSRSLQPPSLVNNSNFFFEEEDYPIPQRSLWNFNPPPLRTMLTNSETLASPKAKVSYDEGQFVVEIPLQEYRVSLVSFSAKLAFQLS